jgi:16S rRNA (adenine1518-N6/adenine1519-N6)-dimethyltransferase
MSEPGSSPIPAAREDWLALLRQLGIRPSRALGQNFLVDLEIVARIVAAANVTEAELVVEIGPGLGVLTEAIQAGSRRLVAVELDRELAAHLRQRFAGDERITIVEADFLRISLDELTGGVDDWIVVANLPYSVASLIVRRLLEAPRPPVRSTVMVQQEVGERLAARPPDMSILSVATQLYARSEVLFTVPASSFIPPPKVRSAVVTLQRRDDVPVAPAERELFFRLVTAGFRQKRKTVANSMANELALHKPDVEARLREAGIDPSLRAERLDVPDWVRLLSTWTSGRP